MSKTLSPSKLRLGLLLLILSVGMGVVVLAVGWGGAGSAEAAPITTVGTFTGGDPGEGLDMEGTFDYAVNISILNPASVTVDDAIFTIDSVAGVTVTATRFVNNWQGGREYGGTPFDNALEAVMRDIRWDHNPPPVTIDLDVTVDSSYKLQLLFAETSSNRGWDVFIEGKREVNNFSVGTVLDGASGLSTGVVITHEFLAKDDQLNIVFKGKAPCCGDNNPIIQGLTLEQVAEFSQGGGGVTVCDGTGGGVIASTLDTVKVTGDCTLTGGNVKSVHVEGVGTLTMTDGTIGKSLALKGTGNSTISGGTVGINVNMGGSGDLDITGGTVTKNLNHSGTGALSIGPTGKVGKNVKSTGGGDVTITGGAVDLVDGDVDCGGGGAYNVDPARVDGTVTNC